MVRKRWKSSSLPGEQDYGAPRSTYLGSVGWAAIVGLALAWPTSASAQVVQTPSCATLTEWSKKLDPKDVWQLSPTNRMALPMLLKGPEMEQIWGKPAMEWGPEDMKVANAALRACGAEHNKAKRAEDAKSISALFNAITGQLNSARNQLIAANNRIDANMKVLLAQQPSRDLLVCFGSLSKIKGAGKDVQNVVYNNPDMRYVRSPFGQNARDISIAVRDGMPESIDPYHDVIVQKFAELRAPVMQQINEEIGAIPASPQGLQQLTTVFKNTQVQLGNTLSQQDMMAIAKMVDDRRDTIEEGMLAQQVALIDTLPMSVEGINGLANISRSYPVTLLTGPRAQAVKEKLLTKRDVIANGIVDQQIAKLADFKGVEGMTQIDAFQQSIERSIGQVAGPQIMERLTTATTAKINQLGKDSFSAYRSQVNGIKEDEAGGAQLDTLMNQLQAVLARLDPDTRTRYSELAVKKKKDIVEAIAAEEKRAERRSLSGATYATEGAGMLLEFRDRKRVYVTNPAGMVEGTYEEDGNRVIIRIPNSNFVLIREGSWLRTGKGIMAMDFRRRPDK